MPSLCVAAADDVARGDTVEIDFEVFCSECGAGLCHVTEVSVTRTRRMPCVIIAPCPDCLKKSFDAGVDDGYVSGADDGYSNGFKDAAHRVDKL